MAAHECGDRLPTVVGEEQVGDAVVVALWRWTEMLRLNQNLDGKLVQ